MADRIYRIFGYDTSKRDFDSLSARLAFVAGPAWRKDVTNDDEITREEAVALLDRDGNGLLEPVDMLENSSCVLNESLCSSLSDNLIFHRVGNLYGLSSFFDSLKDAYSSPETAWFSSNLRWRGIEERSPLSEGNRAYLAFAVLKNFNLMREIPRRHRQAAWSAALDLLERGGVEFERREVSTYEAFRRTLLRNEINFPRRIHGLATALELLRNRASLDDSSDARPIALLFYTTSDYNDAFEQYPVLDTFVNSGSFRVLYYEVSDESEERAIRREVVARTHRRIHTLVYAGHGTRSSLSLGGEGRVDERCERYFRDDGGAIDKCDFDDGDFDDLASQMEPNGQVWLYACSNGKGEWSHDNLVNRFAESLPGRRVYGTNSETNICDLAIWPGSDPRLEIEYCDGRFAAYSAKAAAGGMPHWRSYYDGGLQIGASVFYLHPDGAHVDDGSAPPPMISGAYGLGLSGGYRLDRMWNLRAEAQVSRASFDNSQIESDTLVNLMIVPALKPFPDYRDGEPMQFSASLLLPSFGAFHLVDHEVGGISFSIVGAEGQLRLGDRWNLGAAARMMNYFPLSEGPVGDQQGFEFSLGLSWQPGPLPWEGDFPESRSF